MSADHDKTQEQPAAQAAGRAEAGALAGRSDGEARAAEIREEVAITDQRRAEEEEAKAEEAIADAQKEESKREAKRREAEQRAEAARAQAAQTREHAAGTADSRREPGRVTGGAVASPGLGSDPRAAAAASHTSRHRATSGADPAAGPEKPELEVAAAFAGAFVLARILKKIAG